MKDMKLPGIKSPEDGKSANTGNKKQSDGFFSDIWNDMKGFAGNVGNFGKTLVDGVKDIAKGVKDFAESLTNYMVGSKIWETGAERTKREATDVLAKARAQMLIDFTGDKRSETNQKLANIKAFGAKYGVDVDFIEAEVRQMQDDYDEKQKNREIDARAEQFATGIDSSNPLAYQQVLGREFAEKYQDQDNVYVDTTKPLFTDHHDYLQNTGVFDDWLNVNLDNDSTQYLDHVDYGFEYNYGVEKHKYDSQRYLDHIDAGLDYDYVNKIYKIADDVVGDNDVKRGHDGTQNTWCNRAFDRMLSYAGVNRNMILMDGDVRYKSIHGDSSVLQYTRANDMVDLAHLAAQDPSSGLRLISAEQAQYYANKGFPVMAGYRNYNLVDDYQNKTGSDRYRSGHVALVIPDNGSYDPNRGPRIAQAGWRNYNTKANAYVNKGFGGSWKKKKVEFYLFER